MHASYGELDDLGRDTFVDYQTRAALNPQAFADQHGWHTAQLDHDEPIPVTAQRLAPIMTELRAMPESAPMPRATGNGEVSQ
jgi:hypothetical protein